MQETDFCGKSNSKHITAPSSAGQRSPAALHGLAPIISSVLAAAG